MAQARTHEDIVKLMKLSKAFRELSVSAEVACQAMRKFNTMVREKRGSEMWVVQPSCPMLGLGSYLVIIMILIISMR